MKQLKCCPFCVLVRALAHIHTHTHMFAQYTHICSTHTDAYGASGKGDAVPPNSAIDVELELLSWKRVEEVAGDGAVCKKILTAGSDWKTPNEGSTVGGFDSVCGVIHIYLLHICCNA